MLVELNIKNFAIIEDMQINFTKGLNIITGETGAGKSILIEAIGIILGSRSNRDYIQTGCEKAILEGVFYLEDMSSIKPILEEYSIDVQEDNILIITKEIHQNGPSLSRVNGRNLTLTMLKTITKKLVDIFGQHEHQSLLDSTNHQILVDQFGDDKFYQLKEKTKLCYLNWLNEKNKLKKLSMDSSERDREIDILKYQIEEIQDARLTVEDEKNIENEYKKLFNMDEIRLGIEEALSYLNNEDYSGYNILNLLNKSIQQVNNAKKYDERLTTTYKELTNINYELQDLYRDLKDYLEDMDVNSERLIFLTERINLVNKLKNKYGNTIDEIIKFKNEAEGKLDYLLNFEKEYNNTKNNLELLEKELKNLSDRLTLERKKLSKILEKDIMEELNTLNMKNVKFKVDFQVNNGYSSEGQDKIEFLISTNPGENLKPLSRIVSGGEMSRIMLAFKSIIAFSDKMPTLIFDEIDTGISGRTAQIVGEKIQHISRNHQVICISHLPQIAAMADSHYSINKVVKDNKTKTIVSRLNHDDRIKELARLLGGVDLTDVTLKHAEEMIEMSKKLKKNSI